jgi:hypothetical protein
LRNGFIATPTQIGATMSKRDVKVPCRITWRWLDVSEIKSSLDGGNLIIAKVMTKDYRNRDRQLCTLYLSADIIARMAKDFPSSPSIT